MFKTPSNKNAPKKKPSIDYSYFLLHASFICISFLLFVLEINVQNGYRMRFPSSFLNYNCGKNHCGANGIYCNVYRALGSPWLHIHVRHFSITLLTKIHDDFSEYQRLSF